MDKHPLAQKEVFPILIENQSVWVWAIHLDGAEDPAVVISQIQPMSEPCWEPYAGTFSTFIYTRVWDYQGLFSGHALWGDTCCSSDGLQFLRNHFTEDPYTTTYPTPITYRFSQGTQRVLLWDDPAGGTQWALSAASEDGLQQLLQTIETCPTFAESVPQLYRFER
ncbi:MAG TPA: hypothetical protein VKB76_07170 [Ktedonobacterales bacterium]|nr:hypothetical protein [Ktedonobacterales bacterium]